MDRNGRRNPSQSGIDWNMEYQLAANGYSLDDTDQYNQYLLDEELNDAFANVALQEEVSVNFPNVVSSTQRSSSNSRGLVGSMKKDVMPEQTRQVKLTAGLAAFDRLVKSNLAKGRDPQLHKVPTLKKKERALTAEEKKQLAMEQLIRSPEPPEGQSNVINIAVLMPSGKRFKRRFFNSDSFALLKSYIWSLEGVPNKFEVGTHYPKRILTLDPTSDTPIVPSFSEAGIVSNQMLYVTPLRPTSV